jgi:hypothetical protein
MCNRSSATVTERNKIEVAPFTSQQDPTGLVPVLRVIVSLEVLQIVLISIYTDQIHFLRHWRSAAMHTQNVVAVNLRGPDSVRSVQTQGFDKSGDHGKHNQEYSETQQEDSYAPPMAILLNLFHSPRVLNNSYVVTKLQPTYPQAPDLITAFCMCKFKSFLLPFMT